MSEQKRTAKAVQVGIQLYRPELDKIEDWRRVQSGIPSRSAAVRTFVLRGIKASTDVPATKRAAATDTAA